MRTELFKQICDKLDADVPALKWIDMDWGQLEIPEESYPVQFDCALISYPNIQWEQLGLNVQEGVIQIQLRIGVDMYSDVHIADDTVAPDRALAFAKLNLPNLVFASLNGFEGTFFEKLVRISSTEERREDGLKVFVETYMTRMRETHAVKQYIDHNATLDLTGELVDQV